MASTTGATFTGGRASRRLRRGVMALALTGGVAAGGTSPPAAIAAPCAPDLTVAGVPLSGSDCSATPDGGTLVVNPTLLIGKVVNITGRMILDPAKSLMVQENDIVPLPVRVGSTPVILGKLRVGTFRVCDIPPPSGLLLSPTTGGPLQASETSGPLSLEFLPQETGCRQAPAIEVREGANQLVSTFLAGLPISLGGINPLILGIDEARGGRVFGAFAAVLDKNEFGPNIPPQNLRIGVGVEVSAAEGFKPTSAGVMTVGKVRLLPGLVLAQPALSINPQSQRYSGSVKAQILGKFFMELGLSIQSGHFEALSGGLAFPTAIPVPTPPAIFIKGLSGSWQRGGTIVGPFGITTTTPARVSGKVLFDAGPGVPGTNLKVFSGDVGLTIAGPALELFGNVFAFQEKLALGNARILLVTDPFRFEADASLNFINVVRGRAFLGITANHFTGLGEVSISIPASVPVVGGKVLAGAAAVVSDVAVAAGLTVDPPFLKPRFFGIAFRYNGGFELTNSLAPFITVTPSGSLERNEKGEHAVRNLRFPAGLGEVAIDVTGRKRAPRSVRVDGPGGPVTLLPYGPPIGKTVSFGLKRPRAGTYRVISPDDIVTVAASRTSDIPYIDPQPGYGTRARPPITAGKTFEVCWNVKNAPAGAQVDVFEDQNGFAGTGRDLATGLPAKGCFDVPTTGLEPGRHWVYAVLRKGTAPLSARYWPMGITIVDPAALAAPGNVSVAATADGAQVSFDPVAGAAGYLVTATSKDEVAPAVKQIVVETGARSTVDVSLRGARSWDVSVQATTEAGRFGNPSASTSVAPTDPVVLAGNPTGLARVGKPWAFQLDAKGLTSIKLVEGPRGSKVNAAGLVTWGPTSRAGRLEPQKFTVEGCKADRCITREFHVSAYANGFWPAAPARGFRVLANVVKSGQTIQLRTQGVNAAVVAKIDGKRVPARVLDAGTVELRLPTLKKGPHDVSLKVGGDLEESQDGALVVR